MPSSSPAARLAHLGGGWPLALCVAVAGCETTSQANDGVGGLDARNAPDSRYRDASTTDGLEPDGPEADGGPDVGYDRDVQDPVDSGQSPCDERARRLAQEIYAHPGAVTAVARFDYSTYEPLGFEIFAGPYSAISEAEARVRAQTDTGFGTGGGLVGSGDPFVFYQSPGDFGGVGVVSQRTGLSVFGGEIVWDGRGEISYPSSWRPASELRTRCTSSGGLGPSVSGWNLATSSAIQEAELAPVLDRIRETVIPAAIWFGGYVFDTKVILYPRSVGAFDPSSAEWIVFVNGGWLE